MSSWPTSAGERLAPTYSTEQQERDVVLLAAVEVAVLNDQSLALDAVKLRVAPHQHEASANGTDANADRDLDGRVCAHPSTKPLSQELL